MADKTGKWLSLDHTLFFAVDGKIIDKSREYMTEHHPKRAEFENFIG